MARQLTREYLEEVFAELRPHIPGWKWATMRQRAMARAGGRARGRDDQPNAIEKLALAEIRPAALRDIGDVELAASWQRFNDWFANFTRR